MADLSTEKSLWKKGYWCVAGCDEVGRGSFAGPVVAGCVVFGQNSKIQETNPKINDSKKLTQRQRDVANKWIKKNAQAWGIGSASVTFINKDGIAKATNQAFRLAIKDAVNRGNLKIDYLLIDAFYIPYVRGLRRRNQKAIIGGDSKSISIAAASIVAKVYRDSLMTKLSKNRKYKKYGWERNKGYGTIEHREAIQKYGISRLHRKLWVKAGAI